MRDSSLDKRPCGSEAAGSANTSTFVAAKPGGSGSVKVGVGAGEPLTAADGAGCGEALPEASGSAITGSADSLGVGEVDADVEEDVEEDVDKDGLLELLGEDVEDVELGGEDEVPVPPDGVGEPEADSVAGAGAGGT